MDVKEVRRRDEPSTRPFLDKLGVQPDASVTVIGIEDRSFLELLLERTKNVAVGPAVDGSPQDLIFLAADSPEELGLLSSLESRIARNGAIWVVSRKGREATLRDVEVIAAAKAAGLVDNKVVSFSATHTTLRLVIPRARR